MMIIEPTNMMVGTGTPWDTMVATGEEIQAVFSRVEAWWSVSKSPGKFRSVPRATGWWFGCHFWHVPIYWVANHPNWRTLIFFRGVAQPPIRVAWWCNRLFERYSKFKQSMPDSKVKLWKSYSTKKGGRLVVSLCLRCWSEWAWYP